MNEEKKKICPLQGGSGYTALHCVKERCELWTMHMCSYRTMANALFKLLEHTQEILDKGITVGIEK